MKSIVHVSQRPRLADGVGQRSLRGGNKNSRKINSWPRVVVLWIDLYGFTPIERSGILKGSCVLIDVDVGSLSVCLSFEITYILGAARLGQDVVSIYLIASEKRNNQYGQQQRRSSRLYLVQGDQCRSRCRRSML
jgi:hypothetical protein